MYSSSFPVSSSRATRSTDTAASQRYNPRPYYGRRAARILPCLLALIATLAVLHWAGLPDYAITGPGQSLRGAVLSALGVCLNLYEAYTGYLPGNWDVLWSLSIEEAFYLLFPLACLVSRRWRTPTAALLVLLALSLPVTHGLLPHSTLLREKAYLPGAAAIAVGVVAAIVSRRWPPATRTKHALVVFGAASWTGVMLAEDLIWSVAGESTLLLLTMGTAALVVGLHGSHASPRLTRWLQPFGRLSYEIYLTHMFAVFSGLALFRAFGVPDRMGCLLYPAVLGGALVLGWCVARVLSRPAQLWLAALFSKSGRRSRLVPA